MRVYDTFKILWSNVFLFYISHLEIYLKMEVQDYVLKMPRETASLHYCLEKGEAAPMYRCKGNGLTPTKAQIKYLSPKITLKCADSMVPVLLFTSIGAEA